MLESFFCAVFEEHGAVTISGLQSAARKMKYSSAEHRRDILRLTGEAHICAFDLSPREAWNAIPYFVESGSRDSLLRLFGIAFDRGNLRLADAILATGQIQIPDSKFARWFKEYAVKWFDVFTDNAQGLHFIDPEDQELFHRTIARYYDPDMFWRDVLCEVEDDERYPTHRRELLKRLARGDNAVIKIPKSGLSSEEIFEIYVRDNGISILRMIQRGGVDGRTSSDVYLVQDRDGIMKIYKKLLGFGNCSFRCNVLDEAEILEDLGGCGGIIRPYRTVEVFAKQKYMVLPVVYGKPYTSASNADPVAVALAVAGSLSELHSNGIMHGDIRYQNVLVDPNNGAKLIDLGSARRCGNRSVPVILEDMRFATPECVKERHGSCASDVFSLGVLLASEILGVHPFALSAKYASDNEESEVLRHALPLCLDEPFVSGFANLPVHVRNMLAVSPNDRPRAMDVVLELGKESKDSSRANATVIKAETKVEASGRKIVLFPARMGIPHKGHIEYIRRLIRLGYHVRISLQRSYTRTGRDPLPKWLVMKMVAQSLLNGGCDESDFSFIFTLYFASQAEMRMYFAMMPGREKVVAVASGNQEVEELFPEMPVIDQKAVFGVEGEEFEIMSWGEIVRRAVREGDSETFDAYIASGVKVIRSFEEIAEEMKLPEIPFVEGRVLIDLNFDGQTERVRLLSYIGPEQSIVKHLCRSGRTAEMNDPYLRESLVEVDGKSYRLNYRSCEKRGNDLVCSFDLIDFG